MQDNSGAPAVGGVLETALYVADLDASAAFYRRLFGFATYLRDDRMCALGVPAGSVLLLFRIGGSVDGGPGPDGATIPGHGAEGRSHLCWKIEHAALEPWVAHLAAQGVPLEARIRWPASGTSLYFRDPDGHSLEVATPGLWPNY